MSEEDNSSNEEELRAGRKQSTLERKGTPALRIRALAPLIIAIIIAAAPALITAATNQQSQQKDNPNITVAAAPPRLGTPIWDVSPGTTNANATVILTVNDTVDLSSVILYYRINGTSIWSNKTMVFTGVVYNATIGLLPGVVYNATIGPFAFGEWVNYYVNATDTLGSFTCSPGGAPTSYYNIALARVLGPPPPLPLSSTVELILICVLIIAAISIPLQLLSIRSRKSTGRGKTQRVKQYSRAKGTRRQSKISQSPLSLVLR